MCLLDELVESSRIYFDLHLLIFVQFLADLLDVVLDIGALDVIGVAKGFDVVQHILVLFQHFDDS